MLSHAYTMRSVDVGGNTFEVISNATGNAVADGTSRVSRTRQHWHNVVRANAIGSFIRTAFQQC